MTTSPIKLSFVIPLLALISVFALFAQDSRLRVYADKAGNVHIVSANGKESVITREKDQVGVDAIQIADDNETAGWLVLYPDPDSVYPVAGKIDVWRNGRIVQSFSSDQTFWSWSLEDHARQVAYHEGPTHGEEVSHCELHDLLSGRLVSAWDGDLGSPDAPAWTKNLDH